MKSGNTLTIPGLQFLHPGYRFAGAMCETGLDLLILLGGVWLVAVALHSLGLPTIMNELIMADEQPSQQLFQPIQDIAPAALVIRARFFVQELHVSQFDAGCRRIDFSEIERDRAVVGRIR